MEKIGMILLCSTSFFAYGWQTPITFTPEWNDASVPCVAFDTSGNAMLVWRLFDGSFTRIQASRYNATLGSWSDAAFISPLPHAREPKVVMNSQGNAVAIWRIVSGSYFVTQASFFDMSGGGWEVPFDLPYISEPGYDAEIPTIAFNDNNKAVACWQQYDGSVWRIQTAVGDITGNWNSPVTVSLPDFYGFSPQVVMNNEASSLVSVVFYGIMQAGGNDCVQTVTSHDGGLTWSSPVALSDIQTSAYVPHIVRDDNDNLIVVWQIKHDDGSWTIQARKFESGAWLAIKDIATGIVMNASRCPNVRIAGNGSGMACMTWFTTAGDTQRVQATVYDGSDWTLWNAQVGDVSDAFEPVNNFNWPNQQVSIDDSGNSIIVWQAPNDVGNLLIHAAVYANAAWTSSIISQVGQDATLPFVALSQQGAGFAAWKRTDGLKLASPINQIQVSQYP